MNPTLAAYDEQVRRHPDPGNDGSVEADAHVVRCLAADGWSGVTWSRLDAESADEAIAEQVRRFAAAGGEWEWKFYSHDTPADLPARLAAAGLHPGEPETLMVVETAELGGPTQIPGVELVPVVDRPGAHALVAVHDEVFGGDHSAIARQLLAGLAQQPPACAGVLAMVGGVPICAGRVELHHGTDFASIWGGGTLPAWRGRGVFRAVVAHRAALAAAAGFRYLQVDASSQSRPILRRLGFTELATTIPFTL